VKPSRLTLAAILFFFSLIVPTGIFADGGPLPLCPTGQNCRGFVDTTLQR
jgi:hypothetical protein